MILVDTSIWVNLLGKRPRFRHSAARLASFATCAPIIQEVLQGARDDAYRRLETAMLALPRLEDPLGYSVFAEAAGLYRRARLRGLTIRSSVDCLVAAVALRHGATIWHEDRDYDRLAAVSDLKVFDGRVLE